MVTAPDERASAPASAGLTQAQAGAQVCALVTCHLDPSSKDLIDELKQHVLDIVVVSDGQPRAAAAALRRLAEQTRVETLFLEPNRGKGHAVNEALRSVLERELPPTAVLVIDGDGQHPPSAIPRFLAAPAGLLPVPLNRVGPRLR